MTDKETGISFNFSGTLADLEEAQKSFHEKKEQRENFVRQCNSNALRNVRHILRKKYGNGPVTILTVLKTIRENGFMCDDFLQETFQLTENDVRRALDQGLVPPSIKALLAQYFEIKD